MLASRFADFFNYKETHLQNNFWILQNYENLHELTASFFLLATFQSVKWLVSLLSKPL